MKTVEKFLKSYGFKQNVHGDAWDKGNTRVYFDDRSIHVVRFNNPTARLVEWNNILDGNMPLESIESVIITMVKS